MNILRIVVLIYWVVTKLRHSKFRSTVAGAINYSFRTFWWLIEDDIHKARETCPDCENQGHCANIEGCLERES